MFSLTREASQRAIFFTVTACALLIIPNALVHAQFNAPGMDTALSISVSPAHPHPGDTVTLSLESGVHDVAGSDITWTVNGTIVAQGVGEQTARITAGKLGESARVQVTLSGDEGDAHAETVITPSSIDLLSESDSYTPPLYAGRALPSAGSHVRLQAIPYLPKQGGGYYSADQLTYTWRLNDSVINASSGRGKSSTVINAPGLFATYTVSVEAAAPVAGISGEAHVTIASVEPQIRLYLDHPLFGVEYWNALSGTTFVPDTEATFIAVPYFLSGNGPEDPQLSYEWHINGKNIPSNGARPDTITIGAGGADTLALLELSLTHATNFLLDINGTWQLTFAKGSTFTPTGSVNDLFHTSQ